MELDATNIERKKLAYSTQFFDFTPDAFIDSVTGPALDVVNEHLEASMERCASEFVGKVKEEDLKQAFALIKDNYASHTTEVFEKFGRYLKGNIFTIPRHIALPEDRPHLGPDAKNYNGQKLESDLKTLDEMRQEVSNVKYRKSVLQDKVANLEIVAERQQKLLQESEKFRAEKCQTDTTIEEQLDKLRNKLNYMKPVLEEIENNYIASNAVDATLLQQKRKNELEENSLTKKMRLNQKENQN